MTGPMRLIHFCKLLLSFSALCAAAMVHAQNSRIQGTGHTIPVSAERRVALVIGNSNYATSPLRNPENDARDIATKLRSLNFEVIERLNLRTAQIGRSLREFRSKLTPGTVALVFYAGHGLQIKGENYLPSVDADIEGEEDVPNQSLGVRQILDLLDEAKTSLNLVFLDACRNNPFARNFRSGGDGLARLNAPSGTLISFATRPGSVAADGTDRNGLYTTHLLAAIDTPNLQVEQVLKRVVSGVRSESKGRQEPWMEGSIEGEFFFLRREEPKGPTAAEAAAAAAAAARTQQEAVDRAVQEALKRSSEQAAKERAELQAQMERTIQQALERQNAMIEADRRARVEAAAAANATRPAAAPTELPPAAQVALPAAPVMQVAALSRPPSGPGVDRLSLTVPFAQGDEWEYAVRDNKFGKQRKLVFRVKAVAGNGDVLEEIVVDRKKVNEWVFSSSATAVGTPIEAEFVIGPNWDGKALPELQVSGPSLCTQSGNSCRIQLTAKGRETLATPAGSYETLRLEGHVNAAVGFGSFRAATGQMIVWYSAKDRRVIRQSVKVSGNYYNADETLELAAVRRSAVAGDASSAQVAALSAPAAGAAANRAVATGPFAPGDVWEYAVRDNRFGKQKTLAFRVKEITAGGAITEDILLNGRAVDEWTFAPAVASAIGVPVEAEFFVGPNWDASAPMDVAIQGSGMCSMPGYSCKLTLSPKGQESLVTPAGNYRALRFDGLISVSSPVTGSSRHMSGQVSVWYSATDRRLLKQSVRSAANLYNVDETIELSAVHRTGP